jgi:hypothetical protein
MSTPANHKDVIYIDVDDEITGIIDKVQSSKQKIVALVLPKRATVLQSVVNMKLLKRTADHTKKNVVLITSEGGLLPLAGSVGIHVARSLNSKPEVPEAPDKGDDKPEAIEEMSDDSDDDEVVKAGKPEKSVDKTKTVGELAGAAALDSELDDTIDFDDEAASADDNASDKKDKSSKEKKNKKLKIPNFNKFRLLLIIGVVALFLLGGLTYAATVVMPKAKVTIKTDSMSVNTSAVVAFKVGTGVTVDAEKGIVPAQSQETKKTMTQEVPATGQQNNGTKATGNLEMSYRDCSAPFSPPDDVAAGVGVSTGGNTFITQKKANFSPDGAGGGCVSFKANTVGIVAQTGGTKFNVSAATFTVVGRSDITAVGTASGGTDNIVKIVTQSDIDSAKQKIGQQDTEQIQQELKSALIDRDLFAVDATFTAGDPQTKLSAEANTPADKVTVTQDITYSMLGTKKEDLEKIVEYEAKKKIDTKKQTIQTFGLEDAVFGLQSKNSDGVSVTMQATALTGAEFNTATIKKQIAGKKANDAKKVIEANPGVTDVKVEYSPFWVSKIPGNVDKITVVVQEPQAKNEQPEQP